VFLFKITQSGDFSQWCRDRRDRMIVGFTTTLYLCNQCLSPLTVWVRIPLRQGVLDITLCDKVCQWLTTGRWFSLGTPVSSTNKTDRHDSMPIYPLQRVFYPQNRPCTPNIVGTFYMQGYKVKEKTAIVPPVSKLSGHPAWYNWNIIERSIKHHKTKSNVSVISDKHQQSLW
jgi:hypothetical protein